MRVCLLGTLLWVLSIVGCNKSDAPLSARENAEPTNEVVAKEAAKETPTMDFSATPATPDKEAAKPDVPPKAADTLMDPSSTAFKVETEGLAVDGTTIPALGSPFLLKRDGLRIETLTLSKGFEKSNDGSRVPVEPGYSFPCDDRRIYVIVDLANPTETTDELKVGWIKPGGDKEGNAVTMTAATKKTWRTFAFNSFANNVPGLWQVVIRAGDDTILARASFEMKPN
jgi:Protein of unknown function (DUF2914)